MTSAKLAELLGKQVELLSEYAHRYDMMPNDIAYMSEAMAALATCLQKLLEANPGTNQTPVSPDNPSEVQHEPDRTSFESQRGTCPSSPDSGDTEA